jgi:hypothetical protein
MENDPNPEFWRWGAAGTLTIIHCKNGSFALVRHRDAGAPSWGDHWTLGSGLSGPDDDLSQPTHTAVREGLEEVRIATRIPKNDPRDQGVIQPVFGGKENEELDNIASDAVSGNEMDDTDESVPPEFRRTNDFASDHRVRVGANFYKAPGEQTLEVEHEDGSKPTTSQSGTLVVDPSTRGIDFMKVVEVDLTEYDMEELVFFDGEVDGKGKPINAFIGCVPVAKETDASGNTRYRMGTELARVQKGGQDVDPKEHSLEKMTPTLSKMYESMNGSAPDPDKLRTFLGNVVATESGQNKQPSIASIFGMILRSGSALQSK